LFKFLYYQGNGNTSTLFEFFFLLRLASKMNRLKGMTLGIVGLGMAGKALLPKAKGFGMRVLAYDPYVPIGLCQELEIGKVDLNHLLVESDYISIHCPLT
jgi:D-3-phosphoglycerate dehydrogenase